MILTNDSGVLRIMTRSPNSKYEIGSIKIIDINIQQSDAQPGAIGDQNVVSNLPHVVFNQIVIRLDISHPT